MIIISLHKQILTSILANEQVGVVISSKDYHQLKIWQKELMPILKQLEKQKYIRIKYGRNNLGFKILKPITKKVVEECS